MSASIAPLIPTAPVTTYGLRIPCVWAAIGEHMGVRGPHHTRDHTVLDVLGYCLWLWNCVYKLKLQLEFMSGSVATLLSGSVLMAMVSVIIRSSVNAGAWAPN